MQVCRSEGELRREKMAMRSSAGKRWTGDTRHRSSCALRAAASSDISGEMSIPREDWESLGCCMKESLSSSSPRSGEVEEEEELDPLELRCSRLERDIVAGAECLGAQEQK